MEDFVPFEIAKKLKEKGFTCELPLAMYNETGQFCLLTSSAPYHVCDSGYKYRMFYDYEDFDEFDYITPTISQVLKWLRENKKLHVSIMTFMFRAGWCYEVVRLGENPKLVAAHRNSYNTYEKAAIAGVNYCLENLI